MAIGVGGLGDFGQKQLENARRDPRLQRGHGAMIGDFEQALEEVERTRLMGQVGLEEIRHAYQREHANLEARGGDRECEQEVQTYWERAEMAVRAPSWLGPRDRYRSIRRAMDQGLVDTLMIRLSGRSDVCEDEWRGDRIQRIVSKPPPKGQSLPERERPSAH